MRRDDVFVTYKSPMGKRVLARFLGAVGAIIILLVVVGTIRDFDKRREAGRNPVPPHVIAMMLGPVGFVALGLWIGFGQTRVDLRRKKIESRPLGIPFPSRSRSLLDAERLYVGFYRAPARSSGSSYGLESGQGRPYWFVRIEGEGIREMLIRQREFDEAVGFAEEQGKKLELPVEVEERPTR